MHVQKLYQFLRVEKLLRDLAGEGLLHTIVILLLSQPYPDRYWEAELLFLRPLLRHIPVCRLAHRELGLRPLDFELRRDGAGHLVDLLVQEGYAAFQGIRHAHFIGFQQNIADQPEIHVDVLHSGRLVEMADPFVVRPGEVRRKDARGLLQEQLFPLLRGEHVGVSDEALLESLAGSLQVILSLEMERHRLGDPRGCLSDSHRHFLRRLQGERLMVNIVAAKQLIRAFAGQDNLDLLAGLGIHEIQCDRGGVRQGLIHVPLDLFQDIPELLLGDHLAIVLDAQDLAELLGVGNLIVLRISEADRKGLGRLIVVGQAGCQEARVDTARQEGSDLDVCHHVVLHGVLHGRIDPVDKSLQRNILIDREVRGPVSFDGGLVVRKQHIMCRHQLVDPFEKGLRQDRILEGQVLLQRQRVHLSLISRVLQDALDLRRKDELSVQDRIVEGLDAEEIPRAEKLLLCLVPDGEGKHAADFLQDVRPPGLIADDQDLGVAVILEGITHPRKLGP